MTILNTQTTLRVQTFHTIILLVLFSAFGIGKCHAVQTPKEDRPLITMEVVNGYLVMKRAEEPFTPFSDVDSQESNPDYQQHHEQYNHMTEDDLSFDDDDQQEPGSSRSSRPYYDEHLNNVSNGQNSDTSIVSYNAQIISFAQEVPQYRLFMLGNLSKDNISSGTSSEPENLLNMQYQDAIAADQGGSDTNASHNAGAYELTSDNDEGMEEEEGSMHELPNDNHARVGLGYIFRDFYYIKSNNTFVNSGQENTPEGSMGEEEDSMNHGNSANLIMSHPDNASHHNIVHQARDQDNVRFTTNTTAGASNIIWVYIIFGIFYLTRYFFKIRILAKEGSSILAIG